MGKKFSGAILLAIFFSATAQQVSAGDDILIRGRVSVGYSSYALPDATSQYLAIGVGITYVTGNIFFDAFGSSSVDATHDWPSFEGEFQRTDTALTGGYLLGDGWSIFGGYKWGTSEFSRNVDASYKLTFEAYGIFGGVSKTIGLSRGTSISLSGALASMEGDLYNTSTLNDSGKTLGLSFSAAYKLSLSADSGIRIRGFYQNYSYSDFNSESDFDEEILGVEAGYHLDF